MSAVSGDPLVPIAESGTPEDPYAHVRPIVDAEIGWGNAIKGDWFRNVHTDQRVLWFEQPLHLDLIRRTFALPSTFAIGSTERGMFVSDDAHDVVLAWQPPAPKPEGGFWSGVRRALAADAAGRRDRRRIAEAGARLRAEREAQRPETDRL